MTHYGFNVQWLYSSDSMAAPLPPDERALDFMAAHGFNFVRLPTDYRFWTKDHAYTQLDERVLECIDAYLAACQSRGLHLSLNLHRAPGYCINRNDLERHNLWADDVAQDGFRHIWRTFAQRYRGVTPAALSFDLLNEPPEVGQYGMTRESHAALMRSVVAGIRGIDPARPIVIDGLGGGHLAMPELADLGVTHSGRGYQPMCVSHWGATWWDGWRQGSGPHYPGTVYGGVTWDRQALRDFYAPWRDVQALGVPVHIGEFGCYRETPNGDALRWLADLLGVYREFGWGYGLWEFTGNFGIIGHGRPDARIERVDGYDVDVELLDLLKAARETA
ncbi:aryl-phospho-beta-D-glucosidase BglC (GH1 family) [Deinococcus metalli]|uniref:Aryl-phospho-beta-D-glucosidase BglC (GH1 family) n=1 Tax=Deinococcus metalli TaxID=1141878 RepID=A0A7W8KEG2_9DEIO|nr:cellulase family glycosylhydrolase [Deinococcus metalli]MBB5376674.1 aryl-phospho-beta-D-glucosidase BglC (GH1 family) [Deinococcus metalli]GHF42318.1 endoglucanase [Deinococcus metalli]